MALVALVPPSAAGLPVSPAALASHVVVGALGMGMAFSADDGATWVRVHPPTLHDGVNLTMPWRFLRAPNGTAYVGTDAFHVEQGWATSRVLTVTGGTCTSAPSGGNGGYCIPRILCLSRSLQRRGLGRPYAMELD